jgi:hypothetical protein|tara:strand:- start:2348 stop:3778 length:1431 start_codon:yes stop_codon:yes gene_type:complete
MAGSVKATPTFALQPSAERVAVQSNYITNFNFLNQYLPDTYEKEFERYGNRTVASFLRMVGAEMPSNSDLIKWAEQGRLHTKYTNVTSGAAAAQDVATLTVNDALVPGTGGIAIRVGQTFMLSDSSIGSTNSNKGIVTAVNYGAGTIDVAYYEAGGQTMAAGVQCSLFIYGSEFQKGSVAMANSLEADDVIFSNSPIIIKDLYEVSGSDMAQIGWIEVTTENGATGYLWYLKSEHETRLRFEDYLETAMVEAVPAEAGSGVAAIAAGVASGTGNKGSEGLFYVLGQRGNVWGGGIPAALADFDAVIQRLDKQGAIEENVLFVNREFSFDIDDMLAAQNSYGAGGSSYGLFDNDEEMALNLGFSGFRRGYDFYKTDWKYLNDPTMRGDIVGGKINGVLVPAGSTSVYDQILGKNAKRPFLHVRYRASETEDRRYKTWITGSAGGAATSGTDVMQVNFLSERALCTLGANNFFLFQNA